jgi:hypothetical protein
MGWTDLLGGIADVFTGPSGGRGAARPVIEQRLQVLPPRQAPLGEIERAEATTRRLLEDAARDMTVEFYDEEVAPWQKRIESAEAKVHEVDANVVTRLDEMERLLDAMNLKAMDAERLERRVNVLIGLTAASLVATIWFGLHTL